MKTNINKLINYGKKNKMYFISFLLPAVLLVILYILLHIIGGNQIYIISDLREQYLGLFNYYIGIFKGDNSIFYSFQNGLGGSMFGIFAYYLMSPLNLILLFFSQSNIYIATIILTILKTSLCCLTMFIYLKYQFKNKDDIFLLMFSMCYAFMAYNVLYAHNIMWIDVVYMAPLVLLGIDKLIDYKKPLFYIITLFLSICFNYYIAFMLCIFSVIYFFYKLLIKYKIKTNKKQIKSIIKTFIISSLLATLLSSFILMPTLYELFNSTKSSTGIFSEGLKFYPDLFKLFLMTLFGQNNASNLLNKEHVLLYCGVIIIPLVIMYFLNKKIAKREKILSTIVLGIFLISLTVNIINYIWHGFNMPICYQIRYSFLIVLFLILLGAKSLFNLKSLTSKQYLITIFSYPIIVLIIILRKLQLSNFYIILAAIFVYLLYIFLFIKMQKKHKKIKIIIVALVIIELCFNFYISIYKYNYENKHDYEKNIKTYSEHLNRLNHKNGDRINLENPYTGSDSFLFGYNDTNVFMSMINPNIRDFYKKMGYVYRNNLYYSHFTSPVFDSILNVKYRLTPVAGFYTAIDSFLNIKSEQTGFEEKSLVNIYNNPYNLGLGYLIKDKKNIKYKNSAQYQNDVFKKLTNTNKDVFIEKNMTIDQYTYSFDVDTDDFLYLEVSGFKFLNGGLNSFLQVYVNDIKYFDYSAFTRTFLPLFDYADTFKKGNHISIKTKSTNISNEPLLKLYYFDADAFKEAISKVKKTEVKVFDNTLIKMKVNSNKETLFTTIPYEKGFDTYVDGKKIESKKILDCFIGVDLDKGKHEVEFKYHTPYLKLGILISFIGLILSIFYIKRKS